MMNLEKKAKITLIEYSIIKNCSDISFLKCVFISFVFCNCNFTNRNNTNLVSLFFRELSKIYQSQKNELVFYFDSLIIMDDTKVISVSDFRIKKRKDLLLDFNLSNNQISILKELEKISDDVFYGMVIENV